MSRRGHVAKELSPEGVNCPHCGGNEKLLTITKPVKGKKYYKISCKRCQGIFFITKEEGEEEKFSTIRGVEGCPFSCCNNFNPSVVPESLRVMIDEEEMENSKRWGELSEDEKEKYL